MNQPPAANRRGTGWLALALSVIAGGIAAVGFSERVRAAIGISAMPGDAGREPVGEAAHGDAAVAARGHEVVMPVSGVTLAPGGASPAAATSSQAAAQVAPVAPTGKSTADEGKAIEALEAGQRALKTLAWADAGTQATRAASLSETSETKGRAIAMQTFARQAQAAFARLDQRDELVRNWDTHPSLVYLGNSVAIPLAGKEYYSGSELVVAPGDPADFLWKNREAMHVLVKSRNEFIETTMTLEPIEEITRVDVAAVIAQRRAELTAKLDDLSRGAQAGEPLAWYAAARFAYRNRVDDLVSAPLAKAFALDRDLVESVRDDKAARLFAALVFHVANGNRTQAAAFYGRIVPAYADTEHGKQAEAYWKRRSTAPDAPASPAAPVSQEPAAGPKAADAGHGADAEFMAGRDAYAKAQQLPLTDERNALYRAAIAHFDVALAGYKAMQAKTPDDPQLQDRVTETQMLRFAAMKYLTDFE